MRNVRLVNDSGSLYDTHLEDADTGERLDLPMVSASWQHIAGSAPRLTVSFDFPFIRAIADIDLEAARRDYEVLGKQLDALEKISEGEEAPTPPMRG